MLYDNNDYNFNNIVVVNKSYYQENEQIKMLNLKIFNRLELYTI